MLGLNLTEIQKELELKCVSAILMHLKQWKCTGNVTC